MTSWKIALRSYTKQMHKFSPYVSQPTPTAPQGPQAHAISTSLGWLAHCSGFFYIFFFLYIFYSSLLSFSSRSIPFSTTNQLTGGSLFLASFVCHSAGTPQSVVRFCDVRFVCSFIRLVEDSVVQFVWFLCPCDQQQNMTMTSPVEVANSGAKSGWFDSLKRMRKVKTSSTEQRQQLSLDQQGMTGSKSMSSLHAVNHSVQALSRIEQQDHKSSDSLNSSGQGSRQQSVSPKSTWRSKFQRNPKRTTNKEQTGKPPLPDPLPPKQRQQKTDTASHFYTLPRKKPEPMNHSAYSVPQSNPGSIPVLPDPTSRSRSYSTATLDRRLNKRTTVWYTYSESDIRINFKGRVSFPSLPLPINSCCHVRANA